MKKTAGKKLIGLSVSECIKDIVVGRVKLEQVEKIISRTAFSTRQRMEIVGIHYATWFWRLEFGIVKWGKPMVLASRKLRKKRVARARKTLRKLYNSGKIYQPRLTIGMQPDISKTGHWIEDESWVVMMKDEWGFERDPVPEDRVPNIRLVKNEWELNQIVKRMEH